VAAVLKRLEPERSGLASAQERPATVPPALTTWLRGQSVNLARHASGLRPFAKGEFGAGPAAPSEAQRQAVNAPIQHIRRELVRTGAALRAGVPQRVPARRGDLFADLLDLKYKGIRGTKALEQFWFFYFDIFNQRQSRFAPLLLACDRIALDCYQVVYTGLGRARSIPSPRPFAYMQPEQAPATYRRGVRISRLGRRQNPFPLIKLPYHRLMNPWTLGAVPHEVSHNLQADLGLWTPMPRAIYARLRRHGVPAGTARVWARWHKEMFADVLGCLLIGPTFVLSLMDVVGHPVVQAGLFNPVGVHPTPYLRVLINLEVIRRIGFEEEAAAYSAAWRSLYPPTIRRLIPAGLLSSFAQARRAAVETMAFTPYAQLGGKSLAEVVAFAPKDQTIALEAAERLAVGTDPGIVPERFLIAAARIAFDRRLAPSERIAANFYDALGRR
jgi:hypothetical protein